MFSDRSRWDLAPNRLTRALADHQGSGRPLLDLTLSNPTLSSFQYPQGLLASLSQPAAIEYHPAPRGLRSARKAIVDLYRERDPARPLAIDPDHVCLTASTSEAYSFLFRLLCNSGDEVLAPAPSYPLFQFLADINDVRMVHYPLLYDHGWYIDIHALEQRITTATRAILLVHPNNPTGSYVRREEAATLTRLCSAHNLALIVDEVFLDYNLGPAHPVTFVANHDALTFTLNGLSKLCALPQMKLAWIVASGPAHLTADALARLEVIADTYLSVSTPVQLALPELLQARHHMRTQLMERIFANLQELDRQLAAQTLCSRLQVEGGWYTVLRVPAIRSDEDLAVCLLERGVLVHPGHFYDFDSNGFIVISLILPEPGFAQALGSVLKAVPGLTAFSQLRTAGP